MNALNTIEAIIMLLSVLCMLKLIFVFVGVGLVAALVLRPVLLTWATVAVVGFNLIVYFYL